MTDYTQVNISVDDETLEQLDKMTKEDAYENRSAWIRRLIHQEHKRREDARFELTERGREQLSQSNIKNTN